VATKDEPAGSIELNVDLPPALRRWAEHLERGRWPGWLLDENFVLRYVSKELRIFMARSLGREVDDEAIGIGRPALHALLCEAWQATISVESQTALMPQTMEYLKGEFGFTDEQASRLMPKSLLPFYETAEKAPTYGLLGSGFMYTVRGLPEIPVELVLCAIRGEDGRLLGAGAVYQIGLRPTLVSLLARGDEDMYQRMANLEEPRRCQGAILFADLEGSTKLSRSLSTSTYFGLIRTLATAMDSVIASNGGVVGKHAGDGVSGFFIVSEDENASRVADGALTAALEIRAAANNAIASLAADTHVDPKEFGMNVGLHWGTSLFVGQLVPGGRLDVTALGDSVNECARIQEAASAGAILASKHFLEHLSERAVTDAGLDLNKAVYTTVAEVEGVSEKAARDAGSIPVTWIG
jgi:class 3 adenylate cyclase